MTPEEAVAALDAIDGADGEVAHGEADDILLELVPVEVREARVRLVKRARFWACA